MWKGKKENRTIVEAERTTLHLKNIDISFWVESVNTAVYTLNITRSCSDKC